MGIGNYPSGHINSCLSIRFVNSMIVLECLLTCFFMPLITFSRALSPNRRYSLVCFHSSIFFKSMWSFYLATSLSSLLSSACYMACFKAAPNFFFFAIFFIMLIADALLNSSSEPSSEKQQSDSKGNVGDAVKYAYFYGVFSLLESLPCESPLSLYTNDDLFYADWGLVGFWRRSADYYSAIAACCCFFCALWSFLWCRQAAIFLRFTRKFSASIRLGVNISKGAIAVGFKKARQKSLFSSQPSEALEVARLT